MITAADAAAELLARRRGRRCLVDFARYIEVPGAPLEDQNEDDDDAPQRIETQLAAHHILMLEALERTIRKPSGRLMLFMPPGSAKSSYGSVVTPAWAMGANPGFKVIGVSYGSDMAKKFGRRTRSIIKQRKYRNLFGTSLVADQAAADEWALDNGSEYMSGGILSGITGNRADCLVAGTMIETNYGPVAIENIEHCPASVKVLSFNHKLNVMEYQDIEAFSHRKGIGIYRITTARGSVVEATGNHLFYTGRGYVKASSLATGDSLLRQLRKGEGETSIRLPEMGGEVREGSLLLPSLQSRTRVVQGQEKVRRVREPNGKEDAPILRRMPSGSQEVASCDLSAHLPRLPDLQKDFQSGLAWQEGGGFCRLLQPNMCGHRPFSTYEREGEPDVEGWSYASQAAASFSSRVQGDEAADLREGWLYVRDMRGRQEAPRSPHRQLADEQRVNELGNPLPSLPQGSSQELEWEVERDYVISVERIGDEASVFDIQVSKNHNFFANGILVHNCVIIDDPIKGRQDADSETIRQRTWDEYQESVLTRLKPRGSVIIIQTRWHEDDLSGRILPANYNGESGTIIGRDGFEWEVICLAAEAERDDDPLGRKKGEMIWPEWFDEKHWANFRKNPRTWNALFQQRPAPETGDYFQKEWLHIVPRSSVPPVSTMAIYGASDYAVTDKGGDYTVHVVVGVDQQNRLWLLDLWREQTASDVWVEQFCAMVRKWKPIGWAEETGQIKSGVGPFLVKRMIETESFVAREQFSTAKGNKAVRAQSIRGRIALGGLFIPDDLPGVAALVAEMAVFPVGAHDDQVDALGLVGQLLDRMLIGRDTPDTRAAADRRRATNPNAAPKTLDDIVAPPLPRVKRR